VTHGHASNGKITPTYQAWKDMRSRCRREPNYVDRGITVCDRWRSFANFLADMGEKPAGLTLERIDNDRGYGPDNCCWATWTEQNNNRRPRSVISQGVRAARAKFNARQIRAIRASDLSRDALAAQFGVTRGTIWAIQARRRYLDV